jgi:hypothetical protein
MSESAKFGDFVVREVRSAMENAELAGISVEFIEETGDQGGWTVWGEGAVEYDEISVMVVPSADFDRVTTNVDGWWFGNIPCSDLRGIVENALRGKGMLSKAFLGDWTLRIEVSGTVYENDGRDERYKPRSGWERRSMQTWKERRRR